MNWKDRMKSTPKVGLFSAEGKPVRVLEEEITDMPDGHSAKVYSNGVVEMYKDGEYKGDITKESFAKLIAAFGSPPDELDEFKEDLEDE